MKLLIIKKKWVLIVFAAIFVGGAFYYTNETVPTFKPDQKQSQKLIVNMVTGEFKTTTADGKKIEAYRWDPGTIVIPKDTDVSLSIFGVNGEEHPFYIKGTNIKGTVKKGEETIVPLYFEEEGTYQLICDIHTHEGHGVPMTANIVVD